MVLTFKEGMKYPWGKASRLWLALWLLLPIFGWFALGGYMKKIINSIVGGNTRELPAFGKFWDNFGTGFMLFLKILPLMIVVMLVSIIPIIGTLLEVLISLFLLPWLTVNLMQKYTVASTFEFQKAFEVVFGNFGEYIMVLIRSLFYGIIYALLILVLIGIPCSLFGKHIYIADFYAAYGKKAKPAVRKASVVKKAVKKKKKSAAKKKKK